MSKQQELFQREAVVDAILECEERHKAEHHRQATVIMALSNENGRYRRAHEMRGCSREDLDRIRKGEDYG